MTKSQNSPTDDGDGGVDHAGEKPGEKFRTPGMRVTQETLADDPIEEYVVCSRCQARSRPGYRLPSNPCAADDYGETYPHEWIRYKAENVPDDWEVSADV